MKGKEGGREEHRHLDDIETDISCVLFFSLSFPYLLFFSLLFIAKCFVANLTFNFKIYFFSSPDHSILRTLKNRLTKAFQHRYSLYPMKYLLAQEQIPIMLVSVWKRRNILLKNDVP